MFGRKVEIEALRTVIAHFKRRDGRGYPFGQRRLRSLKLMPPKQRRVLGRALAKRLEVVKDEFDAMSDVDQLALLRLGPALWFSFFRENVGAAHFKSLAVQKSEPKTQESSQNE